MCMQPGVTCGIPFASCKPLMAGKPGVSISPSASEYDGARLRGDSLSCELSDEERLRGAMRKVGSKPCEAGTSTLWLPSESLIEISHTHSDNNILDESFAYNNIYTESASSSSEASIRIGIRIKVRAPCSSQGSPQGPHLCHRHQRRRKYIAEKIGVPQLSTTQHSLGSRLEQAVGSSI
jgi:hypothetical protein